MSTKIKRAISLFLSLIILCLIPISASAVIVTPISTDLAYPTLYNSAGPNVEELETIVDIDIFRNHLINGFASCPVSVDVSQFKIPYNESMTSTIYSYIWYETPELFQISGLGVEYTYSGYITGIRAAYRYTASQYQAMLDEFYSGANTLLKGIKGNNKLSEVEKALLLHDRLALWCEYDYERLQSGTMPEESYTAFGVFSQKTAVCLGYALAYDYLLLQVGIDSYYCSSDALNHAWNIVYVNNSKYHVDVTWDDPVWDKSGQVLHNNFLRSTEGIKATNHTATDFDTSPTDTTFDNYYWQNSETAFQLVDDDIYYIDNSAATLNKISDGVTTNCRSLNGIWRYDASSYWPGNFSRLTFDGENLLFSLPDAVYKYDIQTGVSTKIFTPETPAGSYYSIFGFKFDDCKLVCEVINTPDFNADTKKNYTATQIHHVESDWEILNAPTPDAQGLKQKICINCNEALEEKVIPAITVTANENTVIDYENSLIFTDVFTCQDINNLVTVSDATTVSIDSSKSFYGTGTIVTVLVNEEAVHTLTLIVNGDINGDSVCDVLDLAQAQLVSTNKKTPDALDIYAANCGIADTIDETTYQNLVNKALNK